MTTTHNTTEDHLLPEKHTMVTITREAPTVTFSEKNNVEFLFHVVVPETLRYRYTIPIPCEFSECKAKSGIISSLEKQFNSRIIPLKFCTNGIIEDDKLYCIVFLSIPEELISNMVKKSIQKCIFYVGKAKTTNNTNHTEFQVLTERPLSMDLSKYYRDMTYAVFKSEIITI